MDTVEVEKRKFTPREKKYWYSYCTFFCVQILIQFVGIILCFTYIKTKKWRFVYSLFNCTTSALILFFFVFTICLFFNEARNHYVAEWSDHKTWYKVQAIGIAVALITNIILEIDDLA